MSRVIKLRAWDSVKKMMVTDFYKQASNTAGFLDDTGRMMEDGRHEYMQFTGLLDKNGKEIYEGDIINFYWSDYPAHFGAREVFYHVDAFCVKRDKDVILLGDVDQREVIGNIYENPILLSV